MSYRELKAYARPLLRWWWLILLSALLAGASAFLLLRLRAPVYVVNGTLMVGTVTQERNPDANQLSLGRSLAMTYAKLATNGTVVDKVKDALGIDLLPEFSVRAETDAQILQVTVSDESPELAYAVAAELVNQIVLLSPGGQAVQQREEFVQGQLNRLEASINDTVNEIEARQVELSAALSAREIRQSEEQLAALQAKLATLQANYVGLLANTSSGSQNTISVLDPPALPTRPVESNPWILVALAALAGAALGIAAAYLLEFLDDRLLDVEQVREVTGLVTLGAVPESPIEEGASVLTIVNEPFTPAAEAFRVLRTNLLFASVDRPLHILQVTSAGVEEGKSYISANLAASFALTGKRVILVDADLRKPTQHRIFGLVNNKGVTTALVGNLHSLDEVLQETRVPLLQVVTSGPLPPNPAELISSQRMRDFLAAVGPLCDLVIVDSPPVTLVSDSAMLATQTDGVLLVFSAQTVRRDTARNTVAALQQVKAPVLGIALNKAHSHDMGYYYTHSDSYGSHYYQGAYHTSAGERTQAPRPGNYSLDSVESAAREAAASEPVLARKRVPFVQSSRRLENGAAPQPTVATASEAEAPPAGQQASKEQTNGAQRNGATAPGGNHAATSPSKAKRRAR
jgi:non-specific protein-tyrosine kinase